MGVGCRSLKEWTKNHEIKKRALLFISLLLLAAFALHGFFLALSRTPLLSWRFVVNGLVILLLAIFSVKYLLVVLRSAPLRMGLWWVFLGEILFLIEYPTLLVFQEGLHGVFLVGGSLLIILGLWQEKRRSFHSSIAEFLEQIGKPALFLDEEGRIQGMNGKAADLLGYARSELRGCPFGRFLPPEREENAWIRFREIQEGKRSKVLLWVHTKKGREILLCVTPLLPSPGKEKGLVVEIEDVTRSWSNRISLYREGRRLRSYLETIEDVFLILDREGKVQYINRAGASLLGVKRKEILGQTLDRFVREEERPRAEKIFRMLQEGKPVSGRERLIEILTAQGEVRRIRWNYQALSSPTGAVQGFAFSGIDVTQEARHWEELQVDRLFHFTLLQLIHRVLQEEPVGSEDFLQQAVIHLKAVFATEKAWYLKRESDGVFLVRGDGKNGDEASRLTTPDGSLRGGEVFTTGVRWEGSTIFFVPELSRPVFLVIPLRISGQLEGLFLLGERTKPFTEMDVRRAQIIKETLELLLGRRRAEEKLLFLSSHDLLTGALNHKGFREKGEEILALAERYGRPLSVVFLDVDDFKSINDRFGHLFGDRVLSFFAQYLRANLRRNDLLARFGGDEFVLLLPETPGAKAWELLERLQSNPLLLEEGDEVILLRFSVGMSVYPEDGKTLEALMEMADWRMYEGKRARKEKT